MNQLFQEHVAAISGQERQCSVTTDARASVEEVEGGIPRARAHNRGEARISRSQQSNVGHRGRLGD